MRSEDLEELQRRIRRIEKYADELKEEHDMHQTRYFDGNIRTAFQRSLVDVRPLIGLERASEEALVSTPTRTLEAYFPTVSRTPKSRTLPIIPIDVILEIALHLHPLDLLKYSCTNKGLRALILSPKSRRLWREALQSVPGLPPCPEDMSEPAYVARVFDCHCMACGVDGAYYVDYALRVRFCETCFDRNVKAGTEIFPKDVPRVVREVALMLLPSEDRTQYFQLAWMTERTTALDPCKHALDDRYYQPEVDALIKWLWPAPSKWDELEVLLQERFEVVVRRRAQSVVLQAWERCLLIRKDEKEGALRSYGKLLKRLSKENLVSATTFDATEVHSAIQRGRIPHAVNQMAREQALRAQRRYQPIDIHLQARYAELEEHWEYILDNHLDIYDRDLLPNRHDGGRLWDFVIHDETDEIDSDFYNSDHSNDSDPGNERLDRELHDPRRFPVNSTKLWDALESLHEDIRDYISDIEGALAKLMSQAVERERKGHRKQGRSTEIAPEKMLLRAGALFRCYKSIYASSHRLRGDALLKIRLCQGSYDLAQRILDAIGLRRDTKRDLLDDLLCSGRLYCSCGDPFMDAPEDLFWSDFVWHVFVHLNMFRNRRLHKRSDVPDKSLMYINDHADLKSCVKLLPPTADTTPAKNRVCPDPYTRARVNARLAACPEGAQPVCRICATITADEHRAEDIAMPSWADAIVYHMQAKHGRRFNKKDLLFDDSEDLRRPMQLAEKDVHLELDS